MITRALFSRQRRISPSTTSRNDVDIPLLDIKTVEDFIILLKSKRGKDSNAPWNFCHTLAEQLKWSRTLLSLLSVISSESNPALKINKCIDMAYTMLNADGVQVFEKDEVTGTIKLTWIRHQESTTTQNLIGFRYSRKPYIEDDVIMLNRILNYKDVQLETKYNPELDIKLGITARAMICAPINTEKSVIGILKVFRKGSMELTADMKPSFSVNDEIILAFLANIMSIIIKETIQQKAVVKQNVKIESLDHLLDYGVADMEIDDIIQKQIEDTSSTLHAEKVSLFIYNQGSLECRYSEDIKGLIIPTTLGIVGRTFSECCIFNLANARTESSFHSAIDLQMGYHTTSLLSAPVITEEGTVLGVLQALNKRDDSAFSDYDVTQMRNICTRLAFLIHKTKSLSQLEGIRLSKSILCSTAAELYNCQTESQVHSIARNIVKSFLPGSHTEFLKYTQDPESTVDGRIEIQVSTSTTSSTSMMTPKASCRIGRSSMLSSSSSIFFNASSLPASLNECLRSGAAGELSVQPLSGELRGILPESFYESSSPIHVLLFHLFTTLDNGTIIRYYLLIARESKRLVFSPVEKRSMGFLMDMIVGSLKNAQHREMLSINFQGLQQGFQRLKTIINHSNTNVYIFLLRQDGVLIAYNRPLEDLFGDVFMSSFRSGDDSQSPDIDTSDMNRNYVEKQKKPSISGISQSSSGEESGLNFLCCLDRLHGSLGEDIREVMEFGEKKCKLHDTIRTGAYPEGISVSYEIAALSEVESLALETEGLWLHEMSSFQGRDVEETKDGISSEPLATSLKSETNQRAIVVTIQLAEKKNLYRNNLVASSSILNMSSVSKHNSANDLSAVSVSNQVTNDDPIVLPSIGTITSVVEARSLVPENLLLSSQTSSFRYDRLDVNDIGMYLEKLTKVLLVIKSKRQHSSTNKHDNEWMRLQSIIIKFINDVQDMNVMYPNIDVIKSVLSMTSPTLPLDDDIMSLPAESSEQMIEHDAELLLLWDWDFDVLEVVEKSSLRSIIIRMFLSAFNFREIEVNFEKFETFLIEVEKTYRDNPFHNFYHAVCVTHVLSMLIRATDAKATIPSHLLFAILLSAVTHDIGHPGKNNTFLINSGSELALLYNDESVLENFHCATTFSILRLSSSNMFCDMSQEYFKGIRKMIINCILATDMAKHNQVVTEIQSKLLTSESSSDPYLLGRVLLHAADLSNPVRKFSIARKWAQRLSEEYNLQVEEEMAKGLPVQSWMVTKNELTLATGERNFYSFTVKPMWALLSSKYSNLEFLTEQLNSNISTWEETMHIHKNS